jgi:hypothetical protein
LGGSCSLKSCEASAALPLFAVTKSGSFFKKTEYRVGGFQMRALIAVAAAGLAAVGLGVWLNSATQSATEISSVSAPTATVSIWDIHNQAHLEFLPVQQIDDQSLIFTEAKRE